MGGMVPEVFGCRLRDNLFKAHRYDGNDFENERIFVEDGLLLDHEDEGFHSLIVPGDVVVYADWMKPVRVFSERDFKGFFEEAPAPGVGAFTVEEREGSGSSADGSLEGEPVSYVCVEHEGDSARLTWPDWPYDLPEGFVDTVSGPVYCDALEAPEGLYRRTSSGELRAVLCDSDVFFFKHPGAAAGEDEPFGGASQGVVPRFRFLGGCGLMRRGASAVCLRRIDERAVEALDRDGRVLVHDVDGIFLVCEPAIGGEGLLMWCGVVVEHNATAPAGEGGAWEREGVLVLRRDHDGA